MESMRKLWVDKVLGLVGGSHRVSLKGKGGGADGGDAGGCTGRVGNGGGSGFISARTQLAIDLAKKGQAYNAGQHNLSGQVCF